eukprot:TCONS_00037438-protein
MVFLFSLKRKIDWCCAKFTAWCYYLVVEWSAWWYYLVVEWSFGNTNQGNEGVCVRHAIATAVHQFFFNQGIITDRNFLLGDSVNKLEGTSGTMPIVYDGWKSKCMDQDSNLYYDFHCNVEKVEDKNDISKAWTSLQERSKLTITWNRVKRRVIYASYICLANFLCVIYDDCGLEKFFSIHSPLVIVLFLVITILALDYKWPFIHLLELPFLHPNFLKDRRALDQYLLVYKTDVSNHSLHCVYIRSIINSNGGEYNCINSWGNKQRYPRIPVEQEGNELWRVKVHYVSSSSKGKT